MPGQQKDDNPSELIKAMGSLEDRRDTRFDVPIEIEVSGIDQNQRAFHELTCTQNVSEGGCAFLCSVELKADDIVSLRVTSPEAAEFVAGRQTPFQILRVMRQRERWLVAAWKMETKDVWGVNLEQISKHLQERAQKSRQEEDPKRVKQPLRDTDQ